MQPLQSKLSEFHNENILVFELSMQPIEEQIEFSKQYNLNFPILSDHDGVLIDVLDISWYQTTDGTNLIYTARETLFIERGGLVKIPVKNILFNNTEDHVNMLLDPILSLRTNVC